MDNEEMVDAVRNWLDDEGLRYDYDAERALIVMGIQLKSKVRSCNVCIDFSGVSYVVYLLVPIRAGNETLAETSRYLIRANYELINGDFQLNVENGEIRFRTFVNCNGLGQLSNEVIRESIYYPCFMVDRYGNGLAAVAMGFSEADAEIAKIEADCDGEDGGNG